MRSLRWIDAQHRAAGRACAAAAGQAPQAATASYLEAAACSGPPAARRAAHADRWVSAVLQAFERFRVLCAVRDGDWGVERPEPARSSVRSSAAGLLAARGDWYEGRPVMVTRNDAGLGVFNGDIGIALRPARRRGAPLRAFFPDGDRASFGRASAGWRMSRPPSR